MPQRILHKVGVKRISLFVIGVLGIVRGLSYIHPPTIPDGLRTLDLIAPLEFWGWVWAGIGLAAIVGAFTTHYRIPFIPTMIISALWGTSYLAEWAMNFFSRGVDSRDYITAVSYLAQTVLILAVIRLIDPSEVQTREGDEDVS